MENCFKAYCKYIDGKIASIELNRVAGVIPDVIIFCDKSFMFIGMRNDRITYFEQLTVRAKQMHWEDV